MKIIIECSKNYQEQITNSLNNYFKDIQYIDLIHLDASSVLIKEISDISDITYLKKIKDIKHTDIICLISNGEYMFELLELQPLCFLRIPQLEHDLGQLLKHLQYKSKGMNLMIEFKSSYQTIKLNIENIVYVESYSHYLLVHTQNATFKVREKLSSALIKLEPFHFIQVHKSYIVNKNYITNIDKNNVVLLSDIQIAIGQKYRMDCKHI
ncbi:MAG: LytTR family transcriptional regulator DNA-binding domain-containing protein [Coprobacillus sp.]